MRLVSQSLDAAPRKRTVSGIRRGAKKAKRPHRLGGQLNAHLGGSELDRRATEMNKEAGGF